MILCLETATNLCSVALCDTSGIISVKESQDTRSHASVLTVFIEEILKESGIKADMLSAVAVSKGPGSYTGLRIGVSVAKGIAYAASIPLIGIDTTLSMFYGRKAKISSSDENIKDLLFCPMLDARRMEVYYSIYNNEGDTVNKITAEVINESSFMNIPETKKILFFGDGAAKCRDLLNRQNIIFDTDFSLSAAHMIVPVLDALEHKYFEDVAYFEPFYLKDFLTSKPGKNVLGQ